MTSNDVSRQIRLVTDSASMMPASLRDRFEVIVVPLTITIDDVDYFEDDLAPADFYRRLTAGATVTTAAPAPGAFTAAYRQCLDEGAQHVLSIHTGSNYSATVASATLAASLVTVPVTVVDTALASFPVGLSVWSAAEVLAAGGALDAAAQMARSTAADTGSVFVVGVAELARRGGRFVAVDGDLAPTSIIELDANGMRERERAATVEDAIDAMAARTREIAALRPLRVGVGDADRPLIAEALIDRIIDAPGITEVVHYVVGPSVGAHSGAGTVGTVYCPA